MRLCSLLVACSSLLLASLGCGSRAGSEVVLLGHVAPLSGEAKHLGEQERRGLLLAVEQVNRDMLLPNRKLQVLHVDSHDQTDTAQAQAVRLVTLNHTLALFSGHDDVQTLRLAQALRSYQAPLLTAHTLPSSSALETLFSTGIPLARQATVLAQSLRAQLKSGESVLVVGAKSAESSEAVFTQLQVELRQKDVLEVTKSDTLPKEQEKIRAVVFVNCSAETVTTARKAAAEWAQPMVWAFVGNERQRSLLCANFAASAQLLCVTAYHEQANEKSKEFADAYRKQFQSEPEPAAALAYEHVRLLVEALQSQRVALPKHIREALLKKQSYTGLSGPVHWTKDRSVRRIAYLCRADAGKLTLVQELEAPAK